MKCPSKVILSKSKFLNRLLMYLMELMLSKALRKLLRISYNLGSILLHLEKLLGLLQLLIASYTGLLNFQIHQLF